MRLFWCANSPHAALFFLYSGGHQRLFESPSDAPEQTKDIAACGFESRMRLLCNLSIILHFVDVGGPCRGGITIFGAPPVHFNEVRLAEKGEKVSDLKRSESLDLKKVKRPEKAC
jgi:hypothetical protein